MPTSDKDGENIELKPLAASAIGAALEKVERYRLLNEPEDAESICRDILRAEPGNRDATIGLILSLADQFGSGRVGLVKEATDRAASLVDDYEQLYYHGLVFERRGKAIFRQAGPHSGCMAHSRLREAMAWFEKAMACRPEGNYGSVLRWNTCARMIMRHSDIRPSEDEDSGMPAMLE